MIADTPRPTPAEGQALVKIKAFGINRMDIVQRRGNYPVPPQAPKTLGVEFSGVIDSFGPGDHGVFKLGDEVLGLAYGGAYAEYVAVSSKMLIHKPHALTWGGRRRPCQRTGTQALHLVLGFAKGKSILWHAGASGVSIAGMQLSQLAAPRTSTPRPAPTTRCRFITSKLGATAAFNYKTGDWAAKVKEATGGKGVDFIVDFVGGSYFQQNLGRRGARLPHRAAGHPGRQQGGQRRHLADSLQAHPHRGQRAAQPRRDDQGRLRDKLETYLPDFEAGSSRSSSTRSCRGRRSQEAHKYMEDAQNSGKIVCTIS